jgi:LacI family transcriptional regulator
MPHRFKVRDIALQAGVSEATVDRVLHARPGVRESTVHEVQQAIADLERQRAQLRLGGRTFLVDVVAVAPERFSAAVRTALEDALPSLHPAVIRCRFHFRETAPVDEVVATLDRIAGHGSHGVVLKAPDLPELAPAVDRLARAGIPVVTLVTDLPSTGRVAYVGMDNRAAGATAAYLLAQWLRDDPGDVLVTLSSGAFRGEEEREMGFRSAMRASAPGRRLVEVTESHGLDENQRRLVRDALHAEPGIRAVYSIGGGNVATLDAFAEAARHCAVFLAHDLDRDNTRLLAEGRVSAVLHHDLDRDVRHACQVVMQAHRALPGPVRSRFSGIQVVTPYNVPPVFPDRR